MQHTSIAPPLAPARALPAPVGRARLRRLLVDLPSFLALVAIGLVFLIPFAWMFTTSFKATSEVFRYTYPLTWKTFIPPSPTLENYVSIFVTWNFQRDLLNTFIAASGQMVGACIMSTLAAFAFSRLHFRGRDLIFAITMLTAFVPFDAIVVPLYVVMKSLGLVSTYSALYLPFIFSPFGNFLMRQSFLEIPRELDEASTIEGASPFGVFWHVVLPNARPGLVTLALIQFMWAWNSYLWPLVIMQDPTKQVVQVTIAKFRTVANFPLFGELFAAACAATIPILLLFFALQRYYIRGMLMSGMK
jgi:multiple sugar transport system permease protein